MKDVIIVGGGLGGLTAGALLAKSGKKVILIEQHTRIGGCATTFKRKGGINFEVALHEIDGLGKTDLKRQIFEILGVFDKVKFLKTNNFYRFKNNNYDIVVPHGEQQVVNVLGEIFPADKKGIYKLMNRMRGVMGAIYTDANWPKWKKILLFPVYLKKLYPIIISENKDLGTYLDSIIDSEDLKYALCANLGYYHDDIYKMDLTYFLIAQGGYMLDGSYYIQGGSQSLSDHLAEVITKNSGEILTRHIVKEIIVEDDKAVGVKYRSRKSEDMLEIRGDKIVINANIPDVVNNLVPSLKETDFGKKVNTTEKSLSLTHAYISLDKPGNEFGMDTYLTMNYSAEYRNISDYKNVEKSEDYSQKWLGIVNYSILDSQLNGNNVAITTADYAVNWRNLSKEEYKDKKNAVIEIMINRLNELYPGIKESIIHQELATPLTIEKYTLNPDGAVYGFAQSKGQSVRSRIQQNDSPIMNMYFASAWTNPGGGFTGSIIAGAIAADIILKE